MSPVLLFYVGVVVFFIRPRPRKLDFIDETISKKMIIDELGAVAGVDASDFKRVDEIAVRRVARMRDEVSFKEAVFV